VIDPVNAVNIDGEFTSIKVPIRECVCVRIRSWVKVPTAGVPFVIDAKKPRKSRVPAVPSDGIQPVGQADKLNGTTAPAGVASPLKAAIAASNALYVVFPSETSRLKFVIMSTAEGTVVDGNCTGGAEK
jgi:hypothetical protein